MTSLYLYMVSMYYIIFTLLTLYDKYKSNMVLCIKYHCIAYDPRRISNTYISCQIYTETVKHISIL